MSVIDFIRRYKWDLGIAVIADGHNYDAVDWNLHIVKAPADRWFADPFILDVTNTDIIVLVEEFSYGINRGRLAKLTIDKNNYKVKDIRIILDLDTHLSFPAIIRNLDGTILIYPENSASGGNYVYKYNVADDTLNRLCQLSNEPLTDAIITEEFRTPYMFSTKIPVQNGNSVFVYKSSNITGEYSYVQRIVLDDCSARSAGDIFKDKDRIIRPAQNCNGGYGAGLVFQEIIQNSDETFSLKELLRKYPPKGYEGMHTYNMYKGYAIVDLHCRRYPNLHNVLKTLKHIVRPL